MNPKQASDLIELLKSFASRTAMYVRKADVVLVTAFLTGFQLVLRTAFGVDDGLRHTIAAKRGWPGPAIALERQMRDAGMSDDQVIAELVAIEIEVIERSTASPT
jgi:hypothetical protein